MTGDIEARPAEPVSDDAGGAPFANASRDWREYASAQEKLDLEGLERNSRRLAAARRKLSVELSAIRNRCLQRRRQALLKEAARSVGVLP